MRMKELQIESDNSTADVHAAAPLCGRPIQSQQQQVTLEGADWELPWSEPETFSPGCGPHRESSESIFPEEEVIVIREEIRGARSGRLHRIRSIVRPRGSSERGFSEAP